MDQSTLLRKLPKVDDILKDSHLFLYIETEPRNLVVDTVRAVINEYREKILSGNKEQELSTEETAIIAAARLKEQKKSKLTRILNATGIVLHTNFGRAILGREAAGAVANCLETYCSLEYNIQTGKRGSRHDLIEEIIKTVTGAEAAMVVNNNAAATMLVLASMARGKEVVVSRGELVEIGGAFRIPDVMKESGAVLREIGTTNKTRIDDYEAACLENVTGAFMKVHTSNYKIIGFTEEASLTEIITLGKRVAVPVIYDIGSGLMLNLNRYGIEEPTVCDAVKKGADVILFSGDKLLGGPQAGIIAGRKKYIDAMKKHPLARALRVDKMTLAALEATMYQYLDFENAKKKIPVLNMICMNPEYLKEKAQSLKNKVKDRCKGYQCEIKACEDEIGAGSAPITKLCGYAVVISHDILSVNEIERRLRALQSTLIGRIIKDRLWLSVRTLKEEELDLAADSLLKAEQEFMNERNA